MRIEFSSSRSRCSVSSASSHMVSRRRLLLRNNIATCVRRATSAADACNAASNCSFCNIHGPVINVVYTLFKPDFPTPSTFPCCSLTRQCVRSMSECESPARAHMHMCYKHNAFPTFCTISSAASARTISSVFLARITCSSRSLILCSFSIVSRSLVAICNSSACKGVTHAIIKINTNAHQPATNHRPCFATQN